MIALTLAIQCSILLQNKGIHLSIREGCVDWMKIHFTSTEKRDATHQEYTSH